MAAKSVGGEGERKKSERRRWRQGFKGDDDDSGFASAFANLTMQMAAHPSTRSAVKDMADSARR